jgi:hypothetical protein
MRRMLGGAIAAALLLAPASVLAQTDTTAQAGGGSAPQSGACSGAQRDSAQIGGAEMSVWNAFRVCANLDDGTFVALGDGTVWEIYLPDRTSTVEWRAGDLTLVRVNPVTTNAAGLYDYVLINGEDGTQARARLGTPSRSMAAPRSLQQNAP